MSENSNSDKKIEVRPNGPYRVTGKIPLVRKSQVVSEHGEPLTWKKEGDIPTPEGSYSLCRCGQSQQKPFCDGTHRQVNFDGTERAGNQPTAERQKDLGGTGINVRLDNRLCMDSGFCGNRLTNIKKMMADTSEGRVRAEIMAMIERCPSGAYVYSAQAGEADIEPDLPQQIALSTEITSDGPIEGPLWVTGYIPVQQSDGTLLETRNRVTLCNCGKSRNKPLCDGTHRHHH